MIAAAVKLLLKWAQIIGRFLMSLRDTIESNRVAAAVVAALVLAAAVMLMSRGKTPTGPTHRWFYDLQANRLFPEKSALPPITAPSGGQGVLAHVFACGECTENNRQVAYLETYTENGLIHRNEDATGAINPGHLVALPPSNGTQPRWVPSESSAGITITMNQSASLRQQCPDPKGFQPCLPK